MHDRVLVCVACMVCVCVMYVRAYTPVAGVFIDTLNRASELSFF